MDYFFGQHCRNQVRLWWCAVICTCARVQQKVEHSTIREFCLTFPNPKVAKRMQHSELKRSQIILKLNYRLAQSQRGPVIVLV